ncbi:mycofactocin-coupled SDR family oxidoreductase [Amycolatopsis pithecellobii]|uniref:Mycofactocin-coupled SDR family oxidoreductase n=1 Tax=Amycolatopsis pithecellobii TaxID=664692 RepID=A0A6N7YW93_9PSEU|nr:mycofactocin-coupled SDR family oxidoreductase [Amycolatopsis pithecellobii]MTD57335.1 mycofactocin-coupled SDR family oxidoreductase [Amycolatopsis pithecellobii]
MGRVDGKVALITGAARGQGRAHAKRLAEEGADIIMLDICRPIPGVRYPGATEEDFAETIEMVSRIGRRVVAHQGDVRNSDDVDKIIADGLQAFGHIDVLVGNAGVTLLAPGWEITEADWQTQIDINLTGTWRVAKAVIPSMIEAGKGGSLIFTTSGVVAGGVGNMAHYSATKHGLIGMCKELALELGPHGIRVNTLQPTAVNTLMMDNEVMWALFTPGQEDAPPEVRRKGMLDILAKTHPLGVPWIESEDLADGALYLASDESRRVTGTALIIDAGLSGK